MENLAWNMEFREMEARLTLSISQRAYTLIRRLYKIPLYLMCTIIPLTAVVVFSL